MGRWLVACGLLSPIFGVRVDTVLGTDYSVTKAIFGMVVHNLCSALRCRMRVATCSSSFGARRPRESFNRMKLHGVRGELL